MAVEILTGLKYCDKAFDTFLFVMTVNKSLTSHFVPILFFGLFKFSHIGRFSCTNSLFKVRTEQLNQIYINKDEMLKFCEDVTGSRL